MPEKENTFVLTVSIDNGSDKEVDNDGDIFIHLYFCRFL